MGPGKFIVFIKTYQYIIEAGDMVEALQIALDLYSDYYDFFSRLTEQESNYLGVGYSKDFTDSQWINEVKIISFETDVLTSINSYSPETLQNKLLAYREKNKLNTP